MAKYGNILTVFNHDTIIQNQVETVLTDQITLFVNYNNVYFVETSSKKNTKEVIKALNGLNVEFIFYHNHISDSSLIESNRVADETIKKINKILFE